MIAALLTELNRPLVFTEVEPCALAPGQVLVRVLVSGICGKQLGEIAGTHDADAPRPRLLGHEGCGVVEESYSTKFQKGQKVVMHWRKGSGMESDFPAYDVPFGRITSGKITTFSEFSICSENRLTGVPHETPNELCALLGCGLSTALGVMENEAKLKAGESVLIVGCGGVGLNLIRVAGMMGAARIAGTDILKRKRIRAWEVGADSFYASEHDRWYYADDGEYREQDFDVIVDTTGFFPASDLLAPSGRYIMLGQPAQHADILLPAARHLFDGEGKTIKATQGGGFQPDRDIPRYVRMWKSGHLKIDGIITHRFPFAQINEALDAVRSGGVGRAMLEMI